jgi:hypothetical protein
MPMACRRCSISQRSSRQNKLRHRVPRGLTALKHLGEWQGSLKPPSSRAFPTWACKVQGALYLPLSDSFSASSPPAYRHPVASGASLGSCIRPSFGSLLGGVVDTAAPAALALTDSMPFSAAAFDLWPWPLAMILPVRCLQHYFVFVRRIGRQLRVPTRRGRGPAGPRRSARAPSQHRAASSPPHARSSYGSSPARQGARSDDLVGQRSSSPPAAWRCAPATRETR